MADDGHVYAPQAELEPAAADILQLPAERVTSVLEAVENSELVRRETIQVASSEGRVATGQAADRRQRTTETTGRRLTTHVARPSPRSVMREEQAIYLPALYFSETGLTRQIERLVRHPMSRLWGIRRRGTRGTGERRGSRGQSGGSRRSAGGVGLTVQQQQAVDAALRRKLTILTGGPGTSRTTTINNLLNTLDAAGHSYVLASPTGRAAKRLTEATGREAKTIHRLLEFKPGEGFGRNDHNPIDADLIVIDEASMLDLVLAYNLLKAVDSASHLLLVGDVDQLPSVGAGDVLRDLIASGVAAVIRLEVIFRQATGSLIIRNAHRINQGSMPEGTQEEERGEAEQGRTGANSARKLFHRPPARLRLLPVHQGRPRRSGRPAGGCGRAAHSGQVRPRPVRRRAGAGRRCTTGRRA